MSDLVHGQWTGDAVRDLERAAFVFLRAVEGSICGAQEIRSAVGMDGEQCNATRDTELKPFAIWKTEFQLFHPLDNFLCDHPGRRQFGLAQDER